MKTFIAQNKKEVVKFVTSSGVTCYVDTSIPTEALEGLKQKLAKKIAYRTANCQAVQGASINHLEVRKY